MSKTAQLRRDYGHNIAESMSDPAPSPSDLAEIKNRNEKRDKLIGTSVLRGAMLLPISRIVVDPEQPRKDFDEESLDELAQSIRSRGLLEPIRVRWDDVAKVFVVVFGERRLRACQRAGIDKIEAIEVSGRGRDQTLADQLVENCLRKDLNHVEKAKAIRELVDQPGWDQDRAAKETGISKGHISKLLTMLKAPEDVQQKVASGELSVEAAYNLARVDATTATTIASVPQDTRSARRAAERAGMRTNARTTTWRAVFDEGRVEVVVNEPGAANKKIELLLKRALTELKGRV